jgi:excisionase family DNA binding protein
MMAIFHSPLLPLPRCQPGLSLEIGYFYLDRIVKLGYKRTMRPRLYTTREIAKRAGVSRQTLQAWIAGKKIKAPALIRAAGVRIWTETDLAQVLKVKPRNYPRRPKAKRSG